MPLARVLAPAGVALRLEPSTSARRLALLPAEARLEILQSVSGGAYDSPEGGARSDWVQVRADGQEGYVAAGWLEVIADPTASPAGPPAGRRELRGVWICSHHHSPIWQSRETLAQALDQLVAWGWNTIFPAVWNQGHTAWPSAVMERLGLPRQDPVYAQAGLDPLELVVELGHERGLTVIPWLEYGFGAEAVGAPRALLAARPQWAARDRQGQVVEDGGLRWLNGLDPEVQEFLTELFLEVVECYRVDGVQGDDHLAIPLVGSHDAGTLDRYRRATGRTPGRRDDDPQWSRYRIGELSRWVKRMGERIHAVRPDLLWCMSPCPLPTGLNRLMQDSASWLQEGAVDLLLPQLYRDNLAGFRQVLEGNLRPLQAERRQRLVAGLTLRANGVNLTADTLVQMVKLCREQGLGGVALFHHTPLMGGEYVHQKQIWL